MRGGAGVERSTRRSRPVMAAVTKATSAIPAPNTPAVSRCQATSLTPAVGINRYDGLKPAMPQNAAGRITEPAVWLPNAIGNMPAAMAAQEPDARAPGGGARVGGLRDT